ncbi:AAA family ATPase [archaeon]|nr:MAG: AAA family ATPase [archaeon]
MLFCVTPCLMRRLFATMSAKRNANPAVSIPALRCVACRALHAVCLCPKSATAAGTLYSLSAVRRSRTRCTHPCPVSMICGHVCKEECSHNHPARYKCLQACSRTRLTCNYPCTKKCFDACGNCLVIVSRQLSCGHIVLLPCHTDMSTFRCMEKCKRPLAGCGHACPKLCFETCPAVCLVEVKKLQPCCQNPVPHKVKGQCGVELPRSKCADKCRMALPTCAHLCQEKCGLCLPVGCNPSAVTHATCKKNCGKMLPCNHKCASKHLCGTVCPPCEMPCVMVCAHQGCTQPCGAPCTPCTAVCADACPHFGKEPHICCESDFELGTDPAKTFVCNAPCTKTLQCKHACVGLCNEVCPPICAICMAEKVKTTYKKLAPQRPVAKELVRQARFIVLNCKHSFEVAVFDEYMRGQATLPHYPRCPDCKITVQGVRRYSGLVQARVEQLRPPYFQLREARLRADFEKDLRLKNYRAIIDSSHDQLQKSGRSPAEVQMENPLLEYFLGRVLHLTGQNKEAVVRLNVVLETATNRTLLAEAANTLGIIYRHSCKNIARAIEFFEKAVAFDDSQRQHMQNLLEARSEYEREQQELEKKATETAARLRTKRARAEAIATAPVGPSSDEFESQEAFRGAREWDAQEAEDAQELQRSGGTRMHLAVLRNRPKHVAELLQHDKTLVRLQDNFKKTRKLFYYCNACVLELPHLDSALYTALHWAAKLRNVTIVQQLIDVSPWHLLDVDGKTFIDLALNRSGDETERLVSGLAKNACQDHEADPDKRWAAMRCLDGWRCTALDKLMTQTGLFEVKREALRLFCAVQEDLKRPVKARVLFGATVNFAFVGNPGAGKTTVASIFSDMLIESGLRDKGFVETTGQKLLQAGASKFLGLAQSATPGVLFIDEVYQLDPKADR